MSIIVNVINQKMYVSSHVDELIAGSQNFVKFKFNLDEEWENLVAFAQFQQNGIAYNQYLDDKNTVYLPSEICAGFCTLMLYGSYDKAIGTTNCLTLKIGKNMLIEDAESTEISESLYTQLVTQVQNTQVRLNNLIASEGTSSDTEIIDARVDFQGTTWDTIGNAIRGATQVANRATYIIGIKTDGTINRTMSDIQTAYLAGKNVVLYDNGYVAALEGIAKADPQETGAENFIYTFRCHDKNGNQRVYTISNPNKLECSVKNLRADTPPCNYSNFSIFRSFGVIGDSLSRGVYINENGQPVEDLNQSWGHYLANICNNQHISLGFSGATTSTWLRDRLETMKASDCEVYILALGYNDSVDYNVPLGSLDDINVNDETEDSDGVLQPYGSYYFNVAKILRKIHGYHPKSKTFVLTNPSFEDREGASVEQYNKALREIVAKCGQDYGAYLVDLESTYDYIFQMTEKDRELHHFHPQLYNYFAQVIAAAIGNVMMHNSSAFEDFLNRPYVEEKYIPNTYSVNLFNVFDSRNRIYAYIDVETIYDDNGNVIRKGPIYSPYPNDWLGVTHPIKLTAGTTYKAVHANQMGGIFRVGRVDVHGNLIQVYSTSEDGSSNSPYITIEQDADGDKYLVFNAPRDGLYAFHFAPIYEDGLESSEAFMLCKYDDFPTRKNENGILEYIPYQIMLDEKIDASNVIGLPASSVDNDECTFYVNMTPISESAATSDKTFEEITEAHNSGKNVKCKLDTYVLPLCFINNVQVIFGGATSNLTVFVTQDSNDTVEHSVAELAFKAEVPTIEEFNALAGKVESLPSGGSGGNITYYETSFVLEEDVNKIAFMLPVDAVKFYIWKLSYRIPNTGVTGKRTVYLNFGGGFANLGALNNFGCVSLSGIRHIPNHFAVGSIGRDDDHIEHCSAGFGSGSGNMDAEEGRTDVSIETPNKDELPFPTGTEVWFWGLYRT